MKRDTVYEDGQADSVGVLVIVVENFILTSYIQETLANKRRLTMENPIEALRAEREQLCARIAEIDKALSSYEAWEKKVSALLGHLPYVKAPVAYTGDVPAAAHEKAEPVKNKVVQTPIAEFQDMARKVLGEIDRPLQRAELWELLRDRGLVIDSNDPPNAIGTRLSRMPDVVNLKGYGFWLAARPYAAADHLPKAREDVDDDDFPDVPGRDLLV